MKKMLLIMATLGTLTTMAQTESVTFSTVNNQPREQETVQIMQELLAQYNLSKWLFTTKVQVEAMAIPHSHPILTLNTKYLRDPNGKLGLLSTFIHEQLHWHCEANEKQVNAIIKKLQKKYPTVPYKSQEGAKDEYSTYLHLIVCSLEYYAMQELTTKTKAQEILQAENHYTWIYDTVIKDERYLKRLLKRKEMLL